MSRPKSPIKLNSDRAPSGKFFFRVYFFDPIIGARRKVSTGIEDDGTKTARSRAMTMALEIYQAAKTAPGPAAPKETTLGELLDGFWDPDRSEYLKARLARDPKAIAPGSMSNHWYALKTHVMPYVMPNGRKLVDAALSEIGPDELDGLITAVLSKGSSTRTAKGVIYALAPAFRWAVRKKLIKVDPVPSMMPFAVRAKKRDAFTVREAAALLSPATVSTVWAGITQDSPYHAPHNPWTYYGLAVLTAATGARVSTVMALRREDVEERVTAGVRYYVVSLVKTVRRFEGVSPGTKTGDGTEVPVAAEVLDAVMPHLPAEGPLFPSLGRRGKVRGKTGIITYRMARIHMVEAMRRIGIDDEERESRKLGFHAFRHAFETRARAAGLSREIRAGFTEHRSERVADGYAHPAPEDLMGALPVQRAMIRG